jgi:hypothetical protein
VSQYPPDPSQPGGYGQPQQPYPQQPPAYDPTQQQPAYQQPAYQQPAYQQPAYQAPPTAPIPPAPPPPGQFGPPKSSKGLAVVTLIVGLLAGLGLGLVFFGGGDDDRVAELEAELADARADAGGEDDTTTTTEGAEDAETTTTEASEDEETTTTEADEEPADTGDIATLDGFCAAIDDILAQSEAGTPLSELTDELTELGNAAGTVAATITSAEDAERLGECTQRLAGLVGGG